MLNRALFTTNLRALNIWAGPVPAPHTRT